jgi:hypothetical protein
MHTAGKSRKRDLKCQIQKYLLKGLQLYYDKFQEFFLCGLLILITINVIICLT